MSTNGVQVQGGEDQGHFDQLWGKFIQDKPEYDREELKAQAQMLYRQESKAQPLNQTGTDLENQIMNVWSSELIGAAPPSGQELPTRP